MEMDYKEEYIRVPRGVQLFTCKWLPLSSSPEALVFFCHGYGTECSGFMKGNASIPCPPWGGRYGHRPGGQPSIIRSSREHYSGMWHSLTVGELDGNINVVFADIIAWLDQRNIPSGHHRP